MGNIKCDFSSPYYDDGDKCFWIDIDKTGGEKKRICICSDSYHFYFWNKWGLLSPEQKQETKDRLLLYAEKNKNKYEENWEKQPEILKIEIKETPSPKK
jgi:hypothetical protein